MAFLNKLGKKVAKSDKPTVKKGSGEPKAVKKAAKKAGLKGKENHPEAYDHKAFAKEDRTPPPAPKKKK